LREAQLLTRIRRIRYQLADEDLFVRVKGMDNDVQQLLNLRLKLMFFGTHASTSNRLFFNRRPEIALENGLVTAAPDKRVEARRGEGTYPLKDL
jgi:hypothetical protein